MKLNSVFKSHMVLQAAKPIRFFGSGDGVVNVEFAGERRECRAQNGEWMCEFLPLEYGGPYHAEIDLDGDKISLEDIYIGELLMMSGQSNIEFKMCECDSYEDDLAADENLRYCLLDSTCNPELEWQICNGKNAENWSALGYYIGRQISIERGVKVGIIGCFKGASIIESWIDKDIFEAHPELYLAVDKKHGDHVSEQYSEWNKNGYLYEQKIKKIAPLSLGGVVWYQGESDTSVDEALIYDSELTLMVNVWRELFCDDELKFAVIQIADLIGRAENAWGEVQRAQARVCKAVKNTYLVKSADVCENDRIHPPTKSRLGERAAKIILNWK